MDDPLMQEFLSWGIGDNGEFPDLEYSLLDPTVDGLSPDVTDCSLDELLAISGGQTTTHNRNCVAETNPPIPESAMAEIINQLLSRVATLEAQIQTQSQQIEQIFSYMEELGPFLTQLSSAIPSS
ncbi:hypothetical protein BJX63DRAFT_408714 [Aspergillus granulosus]|uniref:Uncharacterized protein n=1 Tax=Aspergillus granulosus TaxID=176169 RepID=A0ABR4GZL7_9EURO